MRKSIALLVFILIYSVYSKNTKALTESMGQEVIEIGNPLKDLPPDMEEEPSAEVDDDDDEKVSSTSTLKTTIASSTAKKNEKTTGVSKTTETQPSKLLQLQTTLMDNNIRRKGKDPLDRSQEEEEAKIEKELAEIYKDTEDYKADSAENAASVNKTEEKTALRSRNNFKFQPDRINQREVERFRTSVDEISCDRSVTKKMSLPSFAMSTAQISTSLFVITVACILLQK